jgi:putative FmdB family regulatory protein
VPTYDYVCQGTCDPAEFELRQAMSEDPLCSCPACDGPCRRKIGKGSGVIFKGSGFYETDYKPKKKPPAERADQ